MKELIETTIERYQSELELLQNQITTGNQKVIMYDGAIQALQLLLKDTESSEVYDGIKQGLQEGIKGNYPKAQVVDKEEIDGTLVDTQREGKEL